MGKAIELAYQNLEEYNNKLVELRDYYISQIEQKIPYIKVNGHRKKRLPGNSNISFEFVDGEELLLSLDEKGICASSGSACSTGGANPSHVLLEIGIKEKNAKSALRVTFGAENTREDVCFLVNNLVEIIQRLRNMSPEYLEFVKNKL